MHAEAVVGDSVIAGADGADPDEMARCRDAVCLMVHCAQRAQAERCFDALARGGRVIQRLTPHPPPDDNGMGALVRDRYGFKWILTAPNDHK